MPTQPLTTKLDIETASEIERRAAAAGTTKSGIVQEAIAQYLAPATAAPTPTAPGTPAAITPDTRLSLEQLAQSIGLEARDGGYNGFWLGGEQFGNRAGAASHLTVLTGWVALPDGSFAPPGSQDAPPWQPDPNFIAIGQTCPESTLIAEYRLMEPIGGGISKLVLAQKRGPLVRRSELISQLTDGCFVHEGQTQQSTKYPYYQIPIYRRVR